MVDSFVAPLAVDIAVPGLESVSISSADDGAIVSTPASMAAKSSASIWSVESADATFVGQVTEDELDLRYLQAPADLHFHLAQLAHPERLNLYL